MEKKYSSVHYHTYLQLDKILEAQQLRSVELGKPAHEEMLFIVTHQVYELWFKQINHEVGSIMEMFEDDLVDEREIGLAVGRLERIIEIQRLLIQQIGVMETMTPLDFLDFRSYLFPASGFQSFQFRVLEIKLGLKATERLTYNKMPFSIVFEDAKKQDLNTLESRRSLLELVEDWLERMPFLEFGQFNFLNAYKKSVENMLDSEKQAILNSDILEDHTKKQRLRMLGDTDTYFASVLDPDKHAQFVAEGKLKLSYRATMSALLIHLYRDEPILQLPYRFLARLLDMEELFTTWRYRHSQMVLRMIGKKTGTGGSSGHEYLAETAKRHRIFSDLYNISTLLIPRSELPELPVEVKENLGFYYTMSKRK